MLFLLKVQLFEAFLFVSNDLVSEIWGNLQSFLQTFDRPMPLNPARINGFRLWGLAIFLQICRCQAVYALSIAAADFTTSLRPFT